VIIKQNDLDFLGLDHVQEDGVEAPLLAQHKRVKVKLLRVILAIIPAPASTLHVVARVRHVALNKNSFVASELQNQYKVFVTKIWENK